ncbi:MmgE/PrpD family protein [Amycolatopsis sp. NPDC051045]|uniref:MmgE/PrpD family protein n=1 Tax=Amycolatopsis sp. NPDC051045 TaxID=3156922 RepID=UPI003420A6AF
MIADDLGSWAAALRFEDLGEHAIHTVRQRLVDTLGCGLGAFGAEPGRAARRLARALPAGPSTVLGTRDRATADVATFVNGTMVRHLDFNDGYLGLEPGHPSDNIPACLAVAEAEGRSGRDLVTAIALTQAVNVALNGHIAMRQVRAGELSSWKASSAPNAARNGVFSAWLAREGFTGPAPIFEGEMGFMRQVSGSFVLEPLEFPHLHRLVRGVPDAHENAAHQRGNADRGVGGARLARAAHRSAPGRPDRRRRGTDGVLVRSGRARRSRRRGPDGPRRGARRPRPHGDAADPHPPTGSPSASPPAASSSAKSATPPVATGRR